MIVEYFNFIGLGLYFLSACVFLFLFLRTLRTKDGIGLAFLKLMTFSLFIGSATVFLSRLFSEYGPLPFLTARALAVVNPITLLAVALYLNYLFYHPSKAMKSQDSKNIEQIKTDVFEMKQDVKVVKKKV